MENTTSPVAVKQSVCASLSASEGCFCIPSGIRDFIQEGYSEEKRPVITLHKGMDKLGSRTIQIIRGSCREAGGERRVCGECGTKLVQNGTVTTMLRHVPDGDNYRFLEVERHRYRCPKCGCSQDQSISFKDDRHFMTVQLVKFTESLLEAGLTLKETAWITGLHKNVVKAIDKRRLEKLYVTKDGNGNRVLKKPQAQAEVLGIDEFKLHDGHQYATVIINMKTGEIIWLARGRHKQVVYDFIEHVGEEWMAGVKAISSDMNADFAEAFQERCPHLEIVYDRFHIVKNFNDKVINEVRKDEQERLRKEGGLEGARRLKRTKYLLTARKDTLRRRDGEEGRVVRQKSELFKIPEVTGKGGREQRYEELIKSNQLFFACDVTRESIAEAYRAETKDDMRQQIKELSDFCWGTENKHFRWFSRLLTGHIEGIVSFADFRVTNSKLEDINQKIKTIRRKSYGLPDDEYLFLKLIDATSHRRHLIHF